MSSRDMNCAQSKPKFESGDRGNVKRTNENLNLISFTIFIYFYKISILLIDFIFIRKL